MAGSDASIVEMLDKAAAECETVTLEVEYAGAYGMWEATLCKWNGFGVLRTKHVGKGKTAVCALKALEEANHGRR